MKIRTLARLAASIALTVTASLLTLTTQAPSAQAAGCYNTSDRIVTPEEYEQLEPGVTTPADARIITGASGVPMDDQAWVKRYGRMDRSWKVCARRGWVLMSFTRVAEGEFVLQWADVRWS